MRNPLGLRFSTGHALLASALAPPCIIAFLETRYWWAGIALASLGVIVATVTFYGRRITGWVAAVYAWLRRRRRPPDSSSEPVVGATVKPGDHVAVRWQGEFLVAVIELIPRPFTPTVSSTGKPTPTTCWTPDWWRSSCRCTVPTWRPISSQPATASAIPQRRTW